MTAATQQRHGARESEVLGGKYRLETLLGAGGMGEVYRAKRVSDGAPCAVKLLRAEHTSDTVLVERFLRESRVASMVKHPHVVNVIDNGVDEKGTPFLVQELLRGEDLAMCLRSCGGRLSVEVALDLLLPIVEATAAAHEKGVVHRDLKPGNVFLARIDGERVPKLLDFGISSLVASSEASRITSTGTSLGTPAYMSPEQVVGRSDVDERADVWSIGVMLYELVAGALPFTKGDAPGALFLQICMSNPAPLESIVPDVPPGFARVIGRCLRRQRHERYASALELAADLRRVKDGLAVDVPSFPEQRAMPSDVEQASRAAENRAAGGPTDDVATVAGVAPALPSTRLTTASSGATREIELEPEVAESEGQIKLASVAPPPMRFPTPTTASRVHPNMRGAPEEHTPASRIVLVLLGVAILVASGATLASPWQEGWRLLAALEGAGSPRTMMAIAGGVAFVGGALAAVLGVRRAPISAGLVAAALGGMGVAIALGVEAIMPGEIPDLATRVVPWCAAIAPAGLAFHACSVAQRHWSSGRKLVALALVPVAALALAIAGHLARGGV